MPLTKEHHVPAMLQAAQAGTNPAAGAAQSRIAR